MASHEETLAGLSQGMSQCGEIHGMTQNAMQMTTELMGTLQSVLGNTEAYNTVGGYCQAAVETYQASAAAIEQINQTLQELLSRFHG